MKIAAVVYEPGEAKTLDGLFCDVTRGLTAQGLRLAGTIQRNRDGTDEACAHMVLEDLATSRAFPISVAAAAKSLSCALDPAALEDVAGHVANTLAPGIALVVVNRFGKQEALGCGLRSVIEQAAAEEIPLLTALCHTHLASWAAFAGDEWTRLPLDRLAVDAWCRRTISAHADRAVTQADCL